MIGAGEIEKACKEMGFGEWGGELHAALDVESDRKKAKKMRTSQQAAVPPEERARLLETLFAEAAAAALARK